MAKRIFDGKGRLRGAAERLLLRGLLLGQRKDLDYQPLSSFETGNSGRSQGSYSRLKAINKIIDTENDRPRVAMDVGSHIGFFSRHLAKQGLLVYAVESNWDRLSLSFLLARQQQLRLAPIPLQVDRDTVEFLPSADVTLCLSVWHHWVRRFGLKDATHILERIVEKTNRLVFFDSGEEEMPASYNLPFAGRTSADFFSGYLEQLPGVAVRLDLGRHQAISPPDEAGRRQDVFRTLYCLKKVPSAVR
jgi:hypothetical protein